MLKSNKLKTLTRDVSVYNSSNSIKQYFLNYNTEITIYRQYSLN